MSIAKTVNSRFIHIFFIGILVLRQNADKL